ncbi:hypothetical protein [Mangrovimonas spongiae]|uniref:Uncharacterized protein n=1 Tax=Mangrovimonas spongiae TaxID=2494697 RepID=A0A3R9MD13_9FLAO|nr:hypothetical protein [Mangrovimonas spongiae]RSK39163.1 hypothetical protein EJA19_09480 [Mangrovimonas spongiae]
MALFSKYYKYTPYLYFIAVTAYWFTQVNRTEGITAYPILLFSLPFLWQIIKPNRKLNAILGITFVCLSSYLILALLSHALHLVPKSNAFSQYFTYGGLFAVINFIMAVWMIRNTIKKSF